MRHAHLNPTLRHARDSLQTRLLVPLFYISMTRLMALVLRLFARWEVRGAGHVPSRGPLIVVANHMNLIDPPLLSAAVPRRLRFMAKRELFDVRIVGFLVRAFGAFPVRRDEADLQALHIARHLLADGEVLGMFPEGHRNGGAMIAAHPGIGLLALQSGAPVLPVAIVGTERIRLPRAFLQRPRILVSIGQPFSPSRGARVRSEQARLATAEIMQHVAALLPASYRGVYTNSEVD